MTTQKVAQRRLVGFATDLVVQDGDTAYDTPAECAAIVQANTTNSAFSLLWQMTVPAQQILAWGSGSPSQQRNQGYMWFYAMDNTTAFETGNLRLVIANARSTRVRVVKEQNDQRLHTTSFASTVLAQPTSIDNMIALPEQIAFPKVGENSLMQLFYQTTLTSGGTVDVVNFSIPSTIYQ
jgi:hypothetical protein